MLGLRPSLRTLLTAPYLLLVLMTALIIGALSYRTGRDAVDNLSGQLLVETVNRIAQAVDRHVAGSAAVLEAAFPQGVPAPADVAGEIDALRTRFWLATSMHRDPNNYAYYGDRQGRFFGLWRHSQSDAELRLRTRGEGPRSIHRFTGIHGELGPPTEEERVFDPRERPWFRAAERVTTPTWTSIYIDFRTAELVATRTRRVNNAAGRFEGVVATDLSLRKVNDFLRRLSLSKNGLAMVVETDGQLIGVSRGPHLKPAPGGGNARLNAAESADPLVVATYTATRSLFGDLPGAQPRTGVFTGPDGELVQLGYARLRDDAGLDWLIMVAVPRHDFLHDIEENVHHTVLLAFSAAAAVMVIGLIVLGTVTGELRRLSAAMRDVSVGVLDEPLGSDRRDELGDLARSFGQMQRRLLTDHLTGLSNREAIVRRIEERILRQRRHGDDQPFAVLFADLNDFKRVNDRFGHDAGDKALREVAMRLRAAVRANDLVARYAGDEFVVLLDRVDNRRDAEAVREHVEQTLARPLQTLLAIDPRAAAEHRGCACGLAVFPDEASDLESLLKAADEDMYLRKPAS